MRLLNYDKLASEIISWIKAYLKSANAERVVLGLSGGIDSAVTAALCVKAVGALNVLAVYLPCESGSQDLVDAKLVAKTLGIKLKIVDLTSTYHEFLKIISTKIESTDMANANLKPRLRMMTLYYIGQSVGNCLVAGTGNRAELAIGYFTKYGDGGVDFEPIGMLYKSEVRKIAKLLGLPDKIIEKPPSPGLWLGQTDEGEIGLLYDTIDKILYRIDYNLGFEGLNTSDIEKVKNMMKLAEHKLKIPPMYRVN